MTQDKAYHHGTMLLRSDLSTLRACFAVPGAPVADWDSRSVPSVPASVANVSPEISPQAFMQSLLRQFASEHNVNGNDETLYIEEEDMRNMREVQKIKDELTVCNALDGTMKATDPFSAMGARCRIDASLLTSLVRRQAPDPCSQRPGGRRRRPRRNQPTFIRARSPLGRSLRRGFPLTDNPSLLNLTSSCRGHRRCRARHILLCRRLLNLLLEVDGSVVRRWIGQVQFCLEPFFGTDDLRLEVMRMIDGCFLSRPPAVNIIF